MATLTATGTNSAGGSVSIQVTYSVSSTTTTTTLEVTELKLTTYGNLLQPCTINSVNIGNAISYTYNKTFTGSSSSGTTKTISLSKKTTWNRGQSNSQKTINLTAPFYSKDELTGTTYSGTATASANFQVPALPTYTNTYYPNGGSGSNQTQTHRHGSAFTTKAASTFTRTNYTLSGWNTAANGSGTTYNVNTSYTVNSSLSLYAQWTQVYASPQLSITEAYRCDADGIPDDEGAYAGIRCKFSIWDTGNNEVNTSSGNLPTCTVGSGSATASSGDPSTTKNKYSSTLTTSGNWKSGECWFVVSGNLQMENSYTATVTLKDTAGGGSFSQNYVTKTVVITTAYYPIDILAGGHGICFGGVAKDEGFEVDFKEVRLHNAELSTDTFFLSKNLNVDRNVAFGIGSGGNNVGIWDYDLYKWIVYCARSATAPYTYTTYMYDPVSNAYVNMGLQSTSTASDIASAAPGFTITGANYAQWGRVATVEISLRNSSAISSGNITNTTLATMKSGKLPKVAAPFTTGGTGPVVTGYINTNGNVILSATAASIAAATSGTTLTICATYVVA